MILPFLESSDDLHINLCSVLIILDVLGQTKRGVTKVNNEKLHIFLYLIKNPTILNKVLSSLGEEPFSLDNSYLYSISPISPNIDSLFDQVSLKSLLAILVAKDLILVKHKKNEGFVYDLSQLGRSVTLHLQEADYFKEVFLLCEKLTVMLSQSNSQLNKHLNEVFRKESS